MTHTTPDSPAPALISRRAAEVAAALFTGALGATVVVGAREYGVGWDSAGPQPGAFPFYLGLIIVAASLANLVRGVLAGAGGAFVDRDQARQVLAFFGPIVAFVVLTVTLGLYVGAALYLFGVMLVQGKYRWWIALLVSMGVSVFFFVVLERWFQVPLLKGPLEAALGIY